MGIQHQIITQNLHLLKLNRPLVDWQAEELEQQFEQLHRAGATEIIVDLADVSFIDSRGLEALIRGLRLFGPAGEPIKLASPQLQPRLLFDLTGFDQFFPIIERLPAPQKNRPQPAKQRLRSQQVVIAA